MSKQEHPYAQVLRWIADGETVERWAVEGIPFDANAGQRPITPHPASLLRAIANGNAALPEDLRLKPRTITINGHEVPEPLWIAPETGAIYFAADVCMADLSPDVRYWDHGVIGTNRLARGLCHSTREAAEAHARALLSFTAAGAA